MKRKSPKRHRVRHHTRKNKPVREYARGKGQSQTTVTKRRLLNKDEARKYMVTFYYTGNKKELVRVTANNPVEAIEEAYDLREHQNLRPTKVVIKNFLGKILGKIVAKGVGGVKRAISEYKLEREKARAGETARRRELELAKGIKY